ncbi:ATP-binding cassette, subfamily B, MsbA [Nonlabens xylanidelens]|uniref:ATP-binding cassette, subfamily B, MsbA n=1 Tax=Nonlabens xylanidelens TaxID=191564 RepID=A0A2S6INT8_9FLAO|nr:ABC transporter ATP-binding protein [Nonlabens xylanidelens]PPK95841.1 ATP-binding cassette, subfamily B, MsbA [Nonlabens xylanidelens]PQJ22624.1 antibiotic ABC transporter ATP-binding protein [Nonlabens xylanidelens]
MNYFKEILQYAKPYKRYGILNIICNIFYALFSTLTFIALMPVMKVLFQNTERVDEKPEWLGLLDVKDYLENYVNWYATTVVDQDQEKALIAMIIVIVVLALLKNVFGYLGMYFITFLRNGVLRDIRNELYEKIMHLPISFFSEKRKGDVIVRTSSDVEKIQNSFLSILELIVKEPLNVIFTLGAMLLISPGLTIFVLIFIPISGFIISRIGKKLKSQSTDVQKEQGYFTSLLEETLSGLKVIKGFNAEDRLNNTFQKSTQRFYKFSNVLQFRRSMAGPTSEFLGICVISGLFWFGGKMVFGGDLNGEYFVSYMALAYGILTPAKAIAKASYGVKEGNASAERVLEILHTKNEIEDKEGAVSIPAFAKAVNVNNITFSYQDEPVLKNFSLNIPKGTSVALVGQSGSGKSTIANLLTRFYDVENGTITIDGQNIKDVTLKSLRDQMAIVTQDSILFNDTIATNVALSDKNATEEQITDALKIANAWEFVKDLPEGIHTNIGDSGNKLSGGQKQRLSIARAVLKNAPILILDEATSALDTESERLVQDALEKVMKNRTSIVIAHRLSTIQNADHIVVMKKGEIVEQGTHSDLLSKEGLYHGLVGMQSLV